MILTPSTIDAIFFTFSTIYQAGYDITQPFYPQLCTEVPSTGRENRYAWMGRLPKLRKWLGPRLVNNLAARGHTVVNEPYEDTYAVGRDELDDDQVGVFTPAMRMMGEQAAKWPDDMLITAILAADATVCYDGQYFMDSDHPVDVDDASKGTYSNALTSAALTAPNLQACRVAMMQFVGEDGRPLALNPRTLVVPPQLEATAKTIVNSELTAPTAAFGGNAANISTSNVMRGTADILVVPELASEGTVWYLADTSKAIKPFVYQRRKAPAFQQFTSPTDHYVFWEGKLIYGVDCRGAVGYTIPQLICRNVA